MVHLSPYRPSWPLEFEEYKKKILDCAGHLIERVDHIGSTSVPGLVAKDVIDIQIGVRDFTNINTLKVVLAGLGFEMVEEFKQDHVPGREFSEFAPGWEKRFFKSLGSRPVHIHVRQVGEKNYEFALGFRDYLRGCSEAAHIYGQFKQRLAKAVQDNLKAYTLIKDPVCDLIYLLAKHPKS
jgi:GrpB-like predicted nucleotidyltransferase (UPF0157 family)